MATTTSSSGAARERPPPELDFSLIAESRVERLLSRYGLATSSIPSAIRAAALLAALAFVPPFVWAVVHGTAFGRGEGSFRACFEFHVRALVAIPCFVLAGASAERAMHIVLARLHTHGIVPEAQLEQVMRAVHRARELRDSWRAVVIIFSVATLAYFVSTKEIGNDPALTWGMVREGGSSRLGFGAMYYVLLVRPFVTLLLTVWIFRIGLWAHFLFRLARLDLRIVPPHPDQAGGLGFLAYIPVALSPVAFGFSSMVASYLAGRVLYGHVHLEVLAHSTVIVVALGLFFTMLPLIVFAPRLLRARQRGLAEYGAFVARRGRLVEERWIHGPVEEYGRQVEESLNAPELGHDAAVGRLYEAVYEMRPLAVTKKEALFVACAAALPMLPVALIRVPFAELVRPLLEIL